MTDRTDPAGDREEWTPNAGQAGARPQGPLLSELADGRLAPDELVCLTRAWRHDAELRARWHSYQLIGDVLRSPDLAQAHTQAHSEAFLAAVRERLKAEPVVLAPGKLSVSSLARARAMGTRSKVLRTWMGPAAVAACFVLLLGGVSQRLSTSGQGGADARLASWRSPLSSGVSVGGRDLSLAWLPGNGSVVGDANMGLAFADHDQTAGMLPRDPRLEQAVAGVEVASLQDAAASAHFEPVAVSARDTAP